MIVNCDKAAMLLSDDLDGELPGLTRLRLRMHLMMCRRCQAMEGSLRRTVGLLRRLADGDADTAGVAGDSGHQRPPADER